MANFCTNCGQPLVEGKPCSCMAQQQPVYAPVQQQFYSKSFKDRIGLGDPELNKGDAFEKGKLIIPDCVNAGDGETPVKQYKIATLQNRIFGIPIKKAIGKIQVTNKRVIFRAPGKSLAGRTTLQQEVEINEVKSVEARREYVFNASDIIIGLLVAILGGALTSILIGSICSSSVSDGKIAGVVILTLLFGIGGCVPFFTVYKKWLLKLLCLGAGTLPMITVGSALITLANYSYSSAASGFFGGLIMVLGIISLILTIFTLFVYAIKPNLILLIKTSVASTAINVQRQSLVAFGSKATKNTGYVEVIPDDDAERCIREISAIVTDIQTNGDACIDKWKA